MMHMASNMETSDNVTIERFNNFEDKVNDRDLEARLYAEIYYSNEVYGQNTYADKQNVTQTENNADIVASSSTITIPKNNSDSGVNTILRKKKINSPRFFNRENRQNVYSTIRRNMENPRQSLSQNKEPIVEHNPTDMSKSSENRNVCMNGVENGSVGNNEKVSKKTGAKSPKKDNRVITKPYSSLSRRYKYSDEDIMSLSAQMSKYSVASKKNDNLKTITNEESVEISSDSDNSILEVPVPPKPEPLVIQLADSDEDSSEKSARRLKRKPANMKINKTEMAKQKVEKSRSELNESPFSIEESSDENQCMEPVINVRGYAILADKSTDSDSRNREEHEQTQQSTQELEEVVECQEVLSNSPVNRMNDLPEIYEKTNQIVDENDKIMNDNSKKHLSRSKRKRQNDPQESSKEPDVLVPEKRNKKNVNNTEESLTEYFFKPMTEEMQLYFNNSSNVENMDVHDIQSTMPRNPRYWRILDVDLRPPIRRRGKICPRCKTDAHHGKRCGEKRPKPSCVMCGCQGHSGTRCPETMCLTCGRKYTTYRPTCSFCSKLNCHICGGAGHTRKQCPDLWRRFHNTTTEITPPHRDRQSVMKSSEHLICCNCTQRGHDATSCKQLRWSQHFTSPMYVASYTAGPLYTWMNQNHKAPQFPVDSAIYPESAGAITLDNSKKGRTPSETTTEISKSTCEMTLPESNAETPMSESGITPDDNDEQTMLPKNAMKIMETQPILNHGKVNIFVCGNFNPSKQMGFFETQQQLDKMTNIYLDDLLNGTMLPGFLNVWQTAKFKVRITHNRGDGSVLLNIQANTRELLIAVEKLLMQWLIRNTSERIAMIYRKKAHQSRKNVMKKLRKQADSLSQAAHPEKILQKVYKLEEKFKTEISAMCSLKCVEANMRKLKDSVRAYMLNFKNAWHYLNISLYKYSWIEGGRTTVDYFHSLMEQMQRSDKIPLPEYMELLYISNEIFAFYPSDFLSSILQTSAYRLQPCKPMIESMQTLIKTCKNFRGRRNETIFMVLQQTVWKYQNSIFNPQLSDANVVLVPNPEYNRKLSKDRSKLPVQNVETDRGFDDETVPQTVQQSCHFVNNELPPGCVDDRNPEQRETNLTNNCARSNSNVFNQPAANFIGLEDNHLSIREENPLPSTQERKNERRQKKYSTEGLLNNLDAKRKAAYYQSLKAGLKLAASSKIPRLQRFGKVLRFKMMDKTIETADVQALQKSLLKRLQPDVKTSHPKAFASQKFSNENMPNA